MLMFFVLSRDIEIQAARFLGVVCVSWLGQIVLNTVPSRAHGLSFFCLAKLVQCDTFPQSWEIALLCLFIILYLTALGNGIVTHY